jgi:hypothetical protein
MMQNPGEIAPRECEVVAGAVIPGWSEGPDPESRDSGLDAFASPRNDGVETWKFHGKYLNCAKQQE